MFAKDLPFMMAFKLRKVGVLSSRLVYAVTVSREPADDWASDIGWVGS